MKRPIININDVKPTELPEPLAPPEALADRYAPRLARVGDEVGSRLIGCNLIALDPGKRAFPFHNHRVNDEMFLVISGTGEIRIGDSRYPIRAGDLITCPAGGPATAHQIINTSRAELRYLAISTRASPDIIEYPESGKYRVTLESVSAPAESVSAPAFDVIAHSANRIGYWEAE